ncbi:glycosyltransferase family 2 protein [Bradyrhizobium erythrophlei]|uniref:Glycosyltransferase, catalytic subunit of cellulose synthase and poly-beta-1,6-N-acetylglucosamine synthase n=1 Tax=Bradyrhizobium erythrophlei TaxID=1437360 RepID=A0A1M5PBM5_9BRAD|nr:glycosyltransferase family 2 protein [Bradyrhizobium erythrophlei]SHG99166.1 Glycosyltransferase, catalytic subunit of cellulose synthase and poly-beta-1,6-N-acetylglucosamine synthase [Bradyrhizobium erythrophlei]
MGTLVSCLLVIVASLLAISTIVFFLEIVAASAASRWQRPMRPNLGARRPVAVLVPAHNESPGLLPTLANIQGQLLPADRLLVVADNCSDDTAALARAGGAEVVERNDPTKRGKGYALDWGVRHLGSNPPEIVIIIDADCRLAEGAIDSLASTCAMTGRPVQALYLMTAPVNSEINHQVAEFSWRVKNWLRPLGLRALNLPCQLMGTGMAFPWDVIRSADLGNGQIVEDLKLGLDLTLAGHPPVFCPSARVTSEFASSVKGAGSQRQRWEQGHLEMILKTAPRLLTSAITRRDWDLLVITLDLAVPPLSLLGMLVLGIFGFSLLYAVSGYSLAAFTISTASLLAFTAATFLAWLKCGRDVVPPSALMLMPSYAFRKLKLYRQFLFGKIDSQWTRTDRSK